MIPAMTPATIVLCSSALAYGAPIAFAVWQIWSLRKARRGGDDDAASTSRPKPLPGCLQPDNLLRPERIRELHDA